MTEQSTPAGADVAGLSVAVLGGTGDQGRGLARRLALAGHTVHLGSRSAERAEKAARELVEAEAAPIDVRGLDNAAAAAAGDVVIVAVPWDGHRELLERLAAPLAGKIVVDCVNPLGFDKKVQNLESEGKVEIIGTELMLYRTKHKAAARNVILRKNGGRDSPLQQ